MKELIVDAVKTDLWEHDIARACFGEGKRVVLNWLFKQKSILGLLPVWGPIAAGVHGQAPPLAAQSSFKCYSLPDEPSCIIDFSKYVADSASPKYITEHKLERKNIQFVCQLDY